MADKKEGKKERATAMDAVEKPVFSWEAPEFASYSKNSNWFIIIIAVAVALAALFVWQKNWSAVGVTAAAALALSLQAKTRPKTLKCALFRNGIVIDERVYPFEILKSFWIVFGDHPYARVAQARKLSANIHLPIAEEDPEQIRLFLAKFLPQEDQKGEDLSDTLQRWLRF